MATDSLFRPLETSDRGTVSIVFNGRPLEVPADVSVAAALLQSGVSLFRTTPVSGAPRAAYCMMGACFDCLMEIDGVPSRQACLTPVRKGMTVRVQAGARELDASARDAAHEL